MAKSPSRKAVSRSAKASKGAKATRRSPLKSAKVKPTKKIDPKAPESNRPVNHRPDSKQARVIAMLMKPEGASIEAIMKATDWQPHSVRGFFAGVIRKKLKLTLTSEATDAGRVYKINRKATSGVSVERNLKPAKVAA